MQQACTRMRQACDQQHAPRMLTYASSMRRACGEHVTSRQKHASSTNACTNTHVLSCAADACTRIQPLGVPPRVSNRPACACMCLYGCVPLGTCAEPWLSAVVDQS
eukprot:355616-Chlamydomonas_euryale.AAC.2